MTLADPGGGKGDHVPHFIYIAVNVNLQYVLEYAPPPIFAVCSHFFDTLDPPLPNDASEYLVTNET